jgi:hypothetical protein
LRLEGPAPLSESLTNSINFILLFFMSYDLYHYPIIFG